MQTLKKITHKVVKMKIGKLVLAMACVAVLSACDSGKPPSVFSAQYSAPQSSLEVAASSNFTLPLTVKNTSTAAWDSKAAQGPVLAAYHWLAADKKMLLVDGNRTAFATPVAPNAEATIKLAVAAPKAPGDYILQVSLVQEGVSWFESKDVKPLELNIKVK